MIVMNHCKIYQRYLIDSLVAPFPSFMSKEISVSEGPAPTETENRGLAPALATTSPQVEDKGCNEIDKDWQGMSTVQLLHIFEDAGMISHEDCEALEGDFTIQNEASIRSLLQSLARSPLVSKLLPSVALRNQTFPAYSNGQLVNVTVVGPKRKETEKATKEEMLRKGFELEIEGERPISFF